MLRGACTYQGICWRLKFKLQVQVHPCPSTDPEHGIDPRLLVEDDG
jgi:hypothetical protein